MRNQTRSMVFKLLSLDYRNKRSETAKDYQPKKREREREGEEEEEKKEEEEERKSKRRRQRKGGEG